MRLASVVLGLGLGLATAAPLRAQGTRLTGVSVERYHRGIAQLTTVAVRHTELSRRGWGIDVSLGLAPTFLPVEVALPFEAGLARSIRAGPSTVVLKAGVAGIFFGRHLELIPGAQAGVALALPLQRRLELRTDLVGRRYWRDWRREDPVLDMWSVGIGFAVRAPGPRRPPTELSP